MRTVFADTWFYIALLDKDDAHHGEVTRFIANNDLFFVTTRWVLAEVANALGTTPLRRQATVLVRKLETDPDTMVTLSSDDLFLRGFDIYARRADKHWSLTDCISFIVMQEHQITEALTRDHHFNQAGFKALFA